MTNYLTRTLTLCAFFALAALLTVPVQAQNKKSSGTDKVDIVQTAQNAEGFETLVAALKAADLAGTLKGEGPFTVFAPTDKAFAALPDGALENLLKPENKSTLQSLLKYHVVSGKVKAKAVMGMKKAKTLEGSKIGIEVKEGTVTLTGKNNATVTKTDVMASNGVIHVIDSVLMLPERTAMKKNQ